MHYSGYYHSGVCRLEGDVLHDKPLETREAVNLLLPWIPGVEHKIFSGNTAW